MEKISEVGLSDRELEVLLHLVIKTNRGLMTIDDRTVLHGVWSKLNTVYMRFRTEYDFVEL
jgi:hypothetical protein